MTLETNSSTEAIAIEANGDATDKSYRFAVVPKQTSSPFFTVVREGCMQQATKLGNVECLYEGTQFLNVTGQAEIIDELVDARVDGIAVAIAQEGPTATRQAIARAILMGVPVITFDSDDSDSERLAYIGTDNYKFGLAIGKVLDQVEPTGGYYGIITTQAPNAIQRERGVRDRLEKTNWMEISISPGDCEENEVIAIQKMQEFVEVPGLKAILPVGGWPMRNTTLWMEFMGEHPNITVIGADNLPHQMDLLDRGYATGLVGQQPFQMGVMAMNVLLKILSGEEIPEEIYGTSLQEIVTVPLNLPDATVDLHQIGNLKYLGFVFAAIVALASIGFAIWTFVNRRHRVIKASQPIFLIMIAVGALIMGAAMIPMSFDDSSNLRADESCVITCMSTIWLVSIGFTTMFSALFSKTWRINKIFHNPNTFSRIRVMALDVMTPFFLLFFLNVATLTLMTVFSPLEMVRSDHPGTDDWNRVISSYAVCQSTSDRPGGAAPYYWTLGLINLGVLVVANIQAYQARSIQSEFSESQYIAIVMASMLQTFVIAFPVLFLLRDQPRTAYVLEVCTVFILIMVTLLCIFLPKVSNVYFPEEDKATKRSSLSNSFVKPPVLSTQKSNDSTEFGGGLNFTRTDVQVVSAQSQTPEQNPN